MINEDYVSFETSKLLKEKGFDAKCSFVWAEQGNQEPIRMAMPAFVEGEEWADRKTVDIAAKDYINPYNAENNSVTGYLCPTLQMAMKWLREVHNIDIVIDAAVGMLGVKVYVPFISTYKPLKDEPSKVHQIKRGICYKDDKSIIPALQQFDSYEQACEAAIKYCLEHLI